MPEVVEDSDFYRPQSTAVLQFWLRSTGGSHHPSEVSRPPPSRGRKALKFCLSRVTSLTSIITICIILRLEKAQIKFNSIKHPNFTYFVSMRHNCVPCLSNGDEFDSLFCKNSRMCRKTGNELMMSSLFGCRLLPTKPNT